MRTRRAVLVGLVAAVVTVTGPPGAAGVTGTAVETAPAASADPTLDTYVVTLDDPPRPASASYTRRITAEQDRVLERAGNPEVLYRLTAVLNGFVARLTADQVARLRATDGVALVERSTRQRLASVDSPRFLGAERAWAAAGGPDRAGRGIVVGVIDTGLWPENPSFAAFPDRRPPRGFRGACEAGEGWDRSACSSKLVAARTFVKAFGADNLASTEHLSPRDGSGHGSHAAAVAAGNAGVRVRIDGQDLGEASGLAPAAHLAVYKACWTAPDPDDDGCHTADAVAALDRAVADGVDVVSYAVSGPAGATTDAVERAFLGASAAGVFVAAAAGNDGPEAGTAAHASPWVTTVGASTHHGFDGAVVVGDGTTYVGAMVADAAVRRSEIVLAEDVAAPGAQSSRARRCEPGSLAADQVEGRIVVCDRGTTARVDKSAAVRDAGGVGMVLANVRPDTVSADFHAVPTVHVDAAAARAVKRYVRQTLDPVASLDPSASSGATVPQVAPFSSRGEAAADFVKPDLTAPGVSVVSAVAPPSSFDRLWDLASGTSTGTAHVAGIAALVRGERPGWSPGAVRSALATTARDLAGVPGPLAAGAGQVDATDLLDPGLVLEARTASHHAFLAGTLPATRLNLPSIAVPELAGTARVVRRVTSVARRTETYTPSVAGLEGVTATVRPRSLTLAPGESRRVVVDLRVDGAALGSVVQGHLLWTSPRHRVRIPVVVRPWAVAAPDEVVGAVEEGSVAVPAVAGRDGGVRVTVAGFAAATPLGLTLEPGPFDPERPGDDLGTARFDVDVPPGTEVLRIELDGRATDDMDLHLYRDGVPVARASGTSADEVLSVVRPRSGDYTLFVHSASAGNRSTTTAQLYTWAVQPGDAHNVTVPALVPVSSGEPFEVALTWGELDPTRRWFGVVGFDDGEERTFVTVD